MIIKSYLLEQRVQSIDNYKIFLFYGENVGLKKDFKEGLKKLYKSSEVLNLYQDEITKNDNILINEVKNKSLFEEKKIIFIDQANDKLLSLIEELDGNVNEDKIYIFADLLDKKSKLRNYFEKSKDYGVTACYKDNEITVRKIITKKLKSFEGLNTEIINLIIKNTNLDRNKVNNEIEKIISCFENKKLDFGTINILLNNETNDDFNLLKDAALNGNKVQTNRLLADTVFTTENNIYCLNSINQRINKLDQIENMKENNNNISSLIENMKPPVFWKDKPILIEQSKKWNKKKILIAQERTYKAEIEIKSGSDIRKDLIIKKLIVDLCSAANVF